MYQVDKFIYSSHVQKDTNKCKKWITLKVWKDAHLLYLWRGIIEIVYRRSKQSFFLPGGGQWAGFV